MADQSDSRLADQSVVSLAECSAARMAVQMVVSSAGPTAEMTAVPKENPSADLKELLSATHWAVRWADCWVDWWDVLLAATRAAYWDE